MHGDPSAARKLSSSLAKAAPGVLTSDTSVDRLAYARDLWPRHHLDVRAGKMLEGSRPLLVAWPRSTADVAALVRVAANEGVPVVPFGAGSGVCAGVLPDERMLVLDLKKMNAWRELDEDVPSLSVEAGALGITLEEQLQRRGYTVGHFPSSILCSTVGGWLAARGAGQCSGRYGKIEDMVVDLELVDGAGEIATLKRRVHGPDLTPLVIGSEGTLGVITSATLRLHPNPTVRAFSSFTFPSLEAGWTAMRDLFQAGLRPAVSRLYDPFDSMIAKRGSVKKEAPRVSRPGAGLAALASVLRAPRLLNGLVDAMGDKLLGGSTLVLIFEGDDGSPHEDAARAAVIAGAHRGVPLGEGPSRKWLAHRYSVSYRQAPVFRAGAFSDTMEVAAPWSRLGEMYRAVRRALGREVFVMAHLSHAYPDGCSIYFTFAGSAEDDEACAQRYDRAWRAALEAVVGAGGTLSHHHGVGRSKAPRLASELGAGVDLVRAAMRAFDPRGIMNPGSLLPLSGERTGVPMVGATTFTVDESSLLATLPGTMTLREAARALAGHGLELPVAGELDVTVADWLARGAHGTAVPWNDPVDHLLAGLRAELPSGELLDVRPSPRRAVGPDLLALYVGTSAFGKVVAADVRVRRLGDASARVLPFAGPLDPAPTPGEAALLARLTAEMSPV